MTDNRKTCTKGSRPLALEPGGDSSLKSGDYTADYTVNGALVIQVTLSIIVSHYKLQDHPDCVGRRFSRINENVVIGGCYLPVLCCFTG